MNEKVSNDDSDTAGPPMKWRRRCPKKERHEERTQKRASGKAYTTTSGSLMPPK